MKKLALVFIMFALCVGFVFSSDFGLLLDQNAEAENKYYSYTPAFIPWFSWHNRQGMSVYFSGILSLKYNNYDAPQPSPTGVEPKVRGSPLDDISDNDGLRKPLLLPELSRFYFTWQSGQTSIEAGRVDYADVLGQTASGLFDGLRFQTATPLGGISVGAFYTGLLYKETAKILMTANDAAEYAKPLESFSDYCASKRLFAFGRLDMPLLEYHNLFFEVLAQFDLNGNDEKLHSQYTQLALEFFTKNNMKISGGFVFETMENAYNDFTAAFGALAAFETDMPGSLNDRLKITAKFSSGPMDETFTGFMPLSSVTQGMIFPGTFSGIWLAKVNYAVRLLPSLFAETNLSYFGRTYNETGSDGNRYGGEIWASLAWQPLEDIRATLGGGVFLPGTGDVYPAGTDTMWKISAGLLLSF